MINHSIFTDIEHSIAMDLRAAYLSMHRMSDTSSMKYSVTGNRFIIPVLLSQEERTTQQELCDRAFSGPNTIVAMIILLEEREFIKRTQCKNDRLKHIVTTTDKGRNIFEKIWEETKTLRNRFLSVFSIKEIKILTSQLKLIADVMK